MQVHCDYFHRCGRDELKMELSFFPFLAKPYSLPTEVLVKWELEVMHIKVGDIASKQFMLLNQEQYKNPGQANIGDPSFFNYHGFGLLNHSKSRHRF